MQSGGASNGRTKEREEDAVGGGGFERKNEKRDAGKRKREKRDAKGKGSKKGGLIWTVDFNSMAEIVSSHQLRGSHTKKGSHKNPSLYIYMYVCMYVCTRRIHV